MKISKGMATFFYEQCAGTYSGHMSNIANSPTLFGLLSAHSEKPINSNVHALDRVEFAEILEAMAEELRK